MSSKKEELRKTLKDAKVPEEMIEKVERVTIGHDFAMNIVAPLVATDGTIFDVIPLPRANCDAREDALFRFSVEVLAILSACSLGVDMCVVEFNKRSAKALMIEIVEHMRVYRRGLMSCVVHSDETSLWLQMGEDPHKLSKLECVSRTPRRALKGISATVLYVIERQLLAAL